MIEVTKALGNFCINEARINGTLQRGTVVLLTGILLVCQTRAQTYSVEDLGLLSDIPGGTDSGPHAINRAGSVAAVNAVNGAYRAMLYNGTWTDLETLGGSQSLASALNGSGRVVGYSLTATGATNAFLWTPGGTAGVSGNPQMQTLGTLGGDVSAAYSINDSGQITGYSDVPASPNNRQHAFIYSAGALTDIGQKLSSLPNSYGYSINASGHVAGTAYDPSYTTPHAFFFDGSNAADLGLFGGTGSSALALNNANMIIGYLTTTSSVDHAFSYVGGSVTDLGTLGGHYSYALALNNSNAIVGGSFTDPLDSVYHAFLYTNGAMLDLNAYVDQTGAGWTLVEARGINDAGQITGVGVRGGASHAFRLNPTSIALAAPRITSIGAQSSDVVIHFTTIVGKNYSLQSNGTVAGGNWSNVSTTIAGTGNTVSVTDSGALSSSVKFYRVVQLP